LGKRSKLVPPSSTTNSQNRFIHQPLPFRFSSTGASPQISTMVPSPSIQLCDPSFIVPSQENYLGCRFYNGLDADIQIAQFGADPSLQDQTLASLEAPLRAARLALSTRKTYVSSFRTFVRFTKRHSLSALPAQLSTILFFLSSHAVNQKYKAVNQFTPAINYIHHINGYEEPASSIEVNRRVKSVNRTLALDRDDQFTKRQPIDINAFHTYVALKGFVGESLLSFSTNSTMWCLSIRCSFRFSEAANLKRRHIVPLSNGNLSVYLRGSKTDVLNKGKWITIEPTEASESCPVKMVLDHMALGVNEDSNEWLFKSTTGKKFPIAAMNRIILQAHYLIDSPRIVSSHSNRSYAITSLIAAGATDTQVRTAGRMVSNSTVQRYAEQVPTNFSAALNI
jgi:hypothetical protein